MASPSWKAASPRRASHVHVSQPPQLEKGSSSYEQHRTGEQARQANEEEYVKDEQGNWVPKVHSVKMAAYALQHADEINAAKEEAVGAEAKASTSENKMKFEQKVRQAQRPHSNAHAHTKRASAAGGDRHSGDNRR